MSRRIEHLFRILLAAILAFTSTAPAQSPPLPKNYADKPVPPPEERSRAVLHNESFDRFISTASQPERWPAPVKGSLSLPETTSDEALSEIRKEMEARWKDRQSVLDNDRNNPSFWRNTGITQIVARLTQEVNKSNDLWNTLYQQRVDNQNRAEQQLEEFQAKEASVRQALGAVRASKRSAKVSEEILHQKLAGIRHPYLLLATRTMSEDESKLKACQELAMGSQNYVRTNLQRTLVTVNEDALDPSIKSKIKTYQGGEVDQSETDPECRSEEREVFLLERFTFHQRFERSQDDALRAPVSKLKPAEYSEVSGIDKVPESLRKKAREMLEQVQEDRQDAEKNFRTEIEAFHSKLQRTNNEIATSREKISQTLKLILESAEQQHLNVVREQFEEVGRAANEVTNADSADQENIAWQGFLNALKPISEAFIKGVTFAETELKRFLETRKIIVVTSTSEFLQASQTFVDLKEQLLRDAVTTLVSHTRNLISFKFSVVENQRLVSYDAASYYKKGSVEGVWIMDPVETYDGIDLRRLHLVAAWMVQFKGSSPVQTGPPVTPPAIAEQPAISNQTVVTGLPQPGTPSPDLSRTDFGLWFVSESRLDYNGAVKSLPEGYTLCSPEEVQEFLSGPVQTVKNARKLLEPDAWIWTGEKVPVVDQWYAVSNAHEAPEGRGPDFLAYVIAKRDK